MAIASPPSAGQQGMDPLRIMAMALQFRMFQQQTEEHRERMSAMREQRDIARQRANLDALHSVLATADTVSAKAPTWQRGDIFARTVRRLGTALKLDPELVESAAELASGLAADPQTIAQSARVIAEQLVPGATPQDKDDLTAFLVHKIAEGGEKLTSAGLFRLVDQYVKQRGIHSQTLDERVGELADVAANLSTGFSQLLRSVGLPDASAKLYGRLIGWTAASNGNLASFANLMAALGKSSGGAAAIDANTLVALFRIRAQVQKNVTEELYKFIDRTYAEANIKIGSDQRAQLVSNLIAGDLASALKYIPDTPENRHAIVNSLMALRTSLEGNYAMLHQQELAFGLQPGQLTTGLPVLSVDAEKLGQWVAGGGTKPPVSIDEAMQPGKAHLIELPAGAFRVDLSGVQPTAPVAPPPAPTPAATQPAQSTKPAQSTQSTQQQPASTPAQQPTQDPYAAAAQLQNNDRRVLNSLNKDLHADLLKAWSDGGVEGLRQFLKQQNLTLYELTEAVESNGVLVMRFNGPDGPQVYYVDATGGQ